MTRERHLLRNYVFQANEGDAVVASKQMYFPSCPNLIGIENLLREAILIEESEHYDTFSDTDRQEFLFRIFKTFVIGG